MGIEGGHAIEDSLRLLRDYYALGVRYMTLTHTNTNNWADSSGDMTTPNVQHHNGLTDFGKDVVREMNRLGMMVDISHVADKTFWDALEVSKAPIIASHSSCRALCQCSAQHDRRNDRRAGEEGRRGAGQFQLRISVGKIGGGGKTVTPARCREARRRRHHRGVPQERPPATLADVVAHIDHIVKIAGVDAVGIGSDFDGVDCAPEGLDDVSKFPNLTRALLEKGYSAEDIRKIYGGNSLRVMRAVEAEARKEQAGK